MKLPGLARKPLAQVAIGAGLFLSQQACADGVSSLYDATEQQAMANAGQNKTAACLNRAGGGYFAAIILPNMRSASPFVATAATDVNNVLQFTYAQIVNGQVVNPNVSVRLDLADTKRQYEAGTFAQNVPNSQAWKYVFRDAAMAYFSKCDAGVVEQIKALAGNAPPQQQPPSQPAPVQNSSSQGCEKFMDEAKRLAGGEPLPVNPATTEQREINNKVFDLIDRYRRCKAGSSLQPPQPTAPATCPNGGFVFNGMCQTP